MAWMAPSKKAILLLVATVVLWWLGHILLESVWALSHATDSSSLPRPINLLLIPCALAAAWILLPHPPKDPEP